MTRGGYRVRGTKRSPWTLLGKYKRDDIVVQVCSVVVVLNSAGRVRTVMIIHERDGFHEAHETTNELRAKRQRVQRHYKRKKAGLQP